MKSAVVYNKSLNHFGEEVCGDNFQTGSTEDSKIMVLSDGLGSGIKASILAILTTEIITTMIEKGVDIEEVVNTVTKTLPVCKTRGIAYSTFTIVQIFKDGKTKIVNYDNPRSIIIRGGDVFKPPYKEITVNDKKIKSYEFIMEDGDFVFIMSDGVVHAGLGNLMNFGWGIDNIALYLKKMYRKTRDVKEIVDNLIDLTESYYGFKPGDDATLIGIKAVEKPRVMIFTGPPLDPKTDKEYTEKFMEFEGKKIICGGTTGNIIGKIIGKEVSIELSGTKKTALPPYGKMDGIDIVTEGVLTIQALNKMVSLCKKNMYDIECKENEDADGAEKIFSIIRECDEVYILVGRKVNAFYHNPALPFDMSIRSNLIREMAHNLERLGKKLVLEYC